MLSGMAVGVLCIKNPPSSQSASDQCSMSSKFSTRSWVLLYELSTLWVLPIFGRCPPLCVPLWSWPLNFPSSLYDGVSCSSGTPSGDLPINSSTSQKCCNTFLFAVAFIIGRSFSFWCYLSTLIGVSDGSLWTQEVPESQWVMTFLPWRKELLYTWLRKGYRVTCAVCMQLYSRVAGLRHQWRHLIVWPCSQAAVEFSAGTGEIVVAKLTCLLK